MAIDEPPKKARFWSRFPGDWWSYIWAPRSFLSSRDLTAKDVARDATKYLFLGLGGAIAFSAVNLKFSPYATSEASKKFFEGRILTNMLAQGCIITVLLSHLIARILKGRGTLRETYCAFSFTYGFIWPTMSLMLIAIGWFVRLSTGLEWSALPPFDVPVDGSIERTTGNILIVALVATIYLWMIGYMFYCYACAIWASHKFGPARCGLVVVLTIGTVMLFESQLAAVAYKIATTLDPIIEWVLKLVL
jgi:hypothetical protein